MDYITGINSNFKSMAEIKNEPDIIVAEETGTAETAFNADLEKDETAKLEFTSRMEEIRASLQNCGHLDLVIHPGFKVEKNELISKVGKTRAQKILDDFFATANNKEEKTVN